MPLAKFKMMTATLYYNQFLINYYYYLFIVYIYHNTINLAVNLLNSILHQHYIFMEVQTPRATTPRLDLVTHFRSACSSGKTFSIFCLIFIRWSYLFPLYCSCRRFYRNSEMTVQQEHQRSTSTFKIMEEEKSLHGLFLTGVVVVRSS